MVLIKQSFYSIFILTLTLTIMSGSALIAAVGMGY